MPISENISCQAHVSGTLSAEILIVVVTQVTFPLLSENVWPTNGKLFYDPPGTGKASLSFAIAGIFGLDIYCISLQEPTITEEDLFSMFNDLPEQCVVLLEDIDGAGLAARDKLANSKRKYLSSQDSFSSEDDELKASPSGHISVSSLLNIIDGVSSHEGRVLIMTSNHVEHLDDALLRPGRIDLKIQFSLTSRKQAEDIFLQIFSTTITAPNSADLF